jgi:hypothetical protein
MQSPKGREEPLTSGVSGIGAALDGADHPRGARPGGREAVGARHPGRGKYLMPQWSPLTAGKQRT